MPIILLVVAAWLLILSIVNWLRGYGEVGAIWFLGAWMLVGVSGVLSRLDALCNRFDADTRALPIKKKPARAKEEDAAAAGDAPAGGAGAGDAPAPGEAPAAGAADAAAPAGGANAGDASAGGADAGDAPATAEAPAAGDASASGEAPAAGDAAADAPAGEPKP